MKDWYSMISFIIYFTYLNVSSTLYIFLKVLKLYYNNEYA